MKKNVLLITPFAAPNIGGAEVHLKQYYDYLSSHGYRVTLLTYQPMNSNLRGLTLEKHKNLTIHRYQWIGFNLFPRFEKFPPIFNFVYLTPYLLVRSIIFMLNNKDKVDLIHVFGLNAAFIARLMKIFFHKKIYVSMEALYGFRGDNIFGKIVTWVFKDFDTIFVGSEDSKKDVLNLPIPKNKVVVYTHWIETSIFKPNDKAIAKKKVGWSNSFTVLYLGRLIEIKGIHLFLAAMKISEQDIQFKVIGDGTEENPVKEAEKKYKNLEYLGGISNEKTAQYYRAADVLVYPALYEEDLSLVLLESMACGTPVISTNKGSGIYELKEDVAFVIKRDPKELKNKIEYLHKNPKILKKMSQEAAKFGAKFSPNLAALFTKVYNRI